MQAFSAAAAQAGERRAQRSAQQAKAAMQIVAREATERDTAALAPDAMKQAAQLVAAAEAAEAQGAARAGRRRSIGRRRRRFAPRS